MQVRCTDSELLVVETGSVVGGAGAVGGERTEGVHFDPLFEETLSHLHGSEDEGQFGAGGGAAGSGSDGVEGGGVEGDSDGISGDGQELSVLFWHFCLYVASTLFLECNKSGSWLS